MAMPNPFQSSTQSALLSLLHELGATPSRVEVTGDDATVEVDADQVRFWIYPDGACVIGRGADFVYEKWDYGSLDELREDFLSRVRLVMGSS